jgi:hypothetical protein
MLAWSGGLTSAPGERGAAAALADAVAVGGLVLFW